MSPLLLIVLAAAGVALLVRHRGVAAGRDPMGPQPTGELPDTRLVLLLGTAAYLLGLFALGAFLGPSAESKRTYAVNVIVATGLNVLVALPLLPAALSGTRKPTIGWRRRIDLGIVAGCVVLAAGTCAGFVVQLVYELITQRPVPQQALVEQVTGAHGTERLLFAIGAIVLAPFAEEVYFRGILLPALASVAGPRTSNLLQAVIFGSIHIDWTKDWHQWPIAIPLAVVGWCCGYLYLRTGSLLVPVLAHATFNALNFAQMH